MDLKLFSFQSIVCLLFLFMSKSVSSWDDHNITSLRLLQVVSRHGDRTVTKVYPNDPYKNLTVYWPEGLGELTTAGKLRMFKLGQFIRREYNEYLGSDYSPRQIYARSSAKGRCLESLSCLLAGAYPPNNDQWKWNNGTNGDLGSHWQPIPIYTVPLEDMNKDRLLRVEAFCPKSDQDMSELENQELVQNSLKNVSEFLKNLSQVIGVQSIPTLLEAKSVYDHLVTEYDRGLKWPWSPEYEQEVFEKLFPLAELLWITEWNGTVVQRTRAGPLVGELTRNFKTLLSSPQNSKKVYFYSTHDANVAVLMHALQVFDNKIIPLGASLFFELHENPDNSGHYVRLYYFTDTLEERTPHLLLLPKCDYLSDCPTDRFIKISEQLVPEDWDKECGLSTGYKIEISLSFYIIIIAIVLFRKN